MKKLTTDELRQTYLDFFVARGHKLVKSDSLVPANDPSVLFTSAGMNQFKDHFLGRVKDITRATSSQKCMRTGDLDQVGQTPFHHTFFEMLGNFSFGDYFKMEAIRWGWEFVVSVLEIPTADLWVSVYQDDEEALAIWRDQIGLPVEQIRKFGPKDNFWPSNAIADGPNGPCGPCSEIYYRKPNGESVEVWNLVFTQFDRRDGGVLEPLPSKNIDTGMGLERMASVLQAVDSNYQIDILEPVVRAAQEYVPGADRRSAHMIADHARAVTFCIGDGVLPSNDGRGYVVRKLIRRCLYLAQSKEAQAFLYKMVTPIVRMMTPAYPELEERRDNIAAIIKAEEDRYIRNILEGGGERLNAVIADLTKSNQKELLAEVGLDLYVTYGVMPDFTAEMCAKAGISVDRSRIDELIAGEQERSRASSKMAQQIFSGAGVVLQESRFVGYQRDSCQATVIQMICHDQQAQEVSSKDVFGVVLDETPFYAQSGGQVADVGWLEVQGRPVKLIVTDTQKQDQSIIHYVKLEATSGGIRVGDRVSAVVDPAHRRAVKRAHTATHLLQAVLRQVLGPHVQQAGSLVEPDRFRFDFTHFSDISAEQMERIQDLLNEFVMRDDHLNAQVMSKSEAQKTGAIALFGEKYEETVRVVSVGDYSKEFCGGTHLDETGEIGLILLLTESSVGSGVRRIEAVTGLLAHRRVIESARRLEEAAACLKVKPEALTKALEQVLTRQKSMERELKSFQEQNLKGQVDEIIAGGRRLKGCLVVAHAFSGLDPSLLRRSADLLREKVRDKAIVVLATRSDQSAQIVCALTPEAVASGVSADAVIKKILGAMNGSGGGRRDFAQGGTKDVHLLDKALVDVFGWIEQLLP